MHTKHWIPLTAHKFQSAQKLVEHDERCQACGETLGHAQHNTDLLGAAVIDFLQSQGDGSVDVKAVIMLANGGITVRNLIRRWAPGHAGEANLYAAPVPGTDIPSDVFEESPVQPPPPRPRRSRARR